MKFIYVAIFLVVIVIGSFLTGSWYSHRETPKSPTRLSESSTPVGEEERTDQFPPGTVRVNPERQQTIGIRFGVVEKGPVTYTLRTLGRVTIDETRIYRLYAAVDGWIRNVPPISAGSLVKKDTILATYYAPEFRAAEQSYFYALNIQERGQSGNKETWDRPNVSNLAVDQTIDALRNLGMADRQIQELADTRNYTTDIRVIAPVTGFILARNISSGQRFYKGTEWFRLADQSRVWILTDTYENEA